MSTASVVEKREIIARYSENHSGDYLIGTGITLRKYGPDVVSPGNQTDEPRVGIRFFSALGERTQGPEILPVELIVTEDRVLGTREIGAGAFRPSSSSDLGLLKRMGLLGQLPEDLAKLLDGLVPGT